MKLSTFLAGVALAAAASAATAAPVLSTMPNVVVFGDFKGWNSDIEGSLLAKGSAEMYNYGVNTGRLAGDFGAYVGGNLTLMSGQISGTTLVQGALSYSSAAFTQGAVAPGFGSAVDSLQQQMVSLSASYGSAAATGAATMTPWNGLELRGGAADVQVFSLTARDLAAASYLQFYDVTPGSKVVLNVFGDAAYLSNKDLSFTLGAYDTLLNFVDAKSLAIENTAPWASILAPGALITGGSGHIQGTVVAGGWSSQLEVHSKGSWFFQNAFHEPTPAAPIPEPPTILLMAAGMLSMAFFMRARRR